jgi:phosphoribosylanthranilate isomerase
MSRIAIKICGLSTPETLDAALKGGASHVGFVHFAKSPRHVDGDRLAQLAALRRALRQRNADAADPGPGSAL